jgi:hypothetical protein
VVTPDAIEAAIGRVLGPIGTVTTWPPDFPSQALFFDFIETWEIDYQTAWDCPSPTYPTTTLQVALTNVATTATVLNTVGYPATGVIQIDNERMTYTGITSISFTGLTRGAGGTVAVAHAINASVNMAGTPTTAVGISPKIPTDLFVYDPDAIPGHDIYPFNNRWLSEEDFRGAFIVVVPNYPAITDVGMVYDDTASFPFDFLTYNDAAVNIGQRSYSAYDLDVFFSIEGPNNRTLTGGGYDGFDLGKQAVYKGLASQLQRVKAGGVLAVIELQGE